MIFTSAITRPPSAPYAAGLPTAGLGAPDLALAEAPFWSASQAAFLREEIGRDAEWAEVVDRLSLALRGASHRAWPAAGPTGL